MDWLASFRKGGVIPAHPLALTAERKLDERRQRALTRYYVAAGVSGVAVGVHTTQFAIREAGLLRPVLELAREEAAAVVRIGGVCGPTRQAVREAALLRDLGYHAGLLSLAALVNANGRKLIEHVRAVAEVLPVVGFYLQPAVGGRVLPYAFWRQFVEIENVVGIKIAPFNRYQTLDVMRAVAESGRELALYTGNDDNIVVDLLSEFQGVRFVGGLLGHWAVWTKKAVEMQAKVRKHKDPLRLNLEVTDANAAFFDAANGFKGCIAGLHEVLRRQGMLDGIWCLDPHEGLSKGQAEEINRVYAAYPHLNDDAFVAAHRDAWLRG
ncbi:MAG: dihydrodipicolinate synthase family protein [Acidobacteriaceae bacterium]|jgi:dihydrodipicolinate synthase/N-acetylneuraminate lyase|nr:dihydrodipicolinate synthase family protein [Acidobacteriaceae bacterium]